MKKILIYIMFLVFIIPSIKSQDYKKQQLNNKKLDSLQLIKTIDELRTLYLESINNDTIKYKIKFFEIFPETFQLYTEIYGYKNVKTCEEEADNLYNESHDHLKLFCELRSIINKDDYYKKIIKLCINGYWDADAINDLQHCLYKCINEDLPLTIKTLKSFTDKEIESFWYFVFDGPLRTENLPVNIDSIRMIDEHIADLAKKTLIKAKNNLDKNGVYKFRN
jgi:hypothetical protein